MRSRMLQLFPWMGLLILLSSCALLFPDRTAPKSSNYHIEPPGAPWQKLALSKDPSTLESMKADLAYENAETGGIISLNSLCRKYTETDLITLTNNLVRGIEKKRILSRKETKIDDAQALDTLFGGEVDNVFLHIRTVVLSKDDCTYDFLYIAVPSKEGVAEKAFESFLASFRTEN